MEASDLKKVWAHIGEMVETHHSAETILEFMKGYNLLSYPSTVRPTLLALCSRLRAQKWLKRHRDIEFAKYLISWFAYEGVTEATRANLERNFPDVLRTLATGGEDFEVALLYVFTHASVKNDLRADDDRVFLFLKSAVMANRLQARMSVSKFVLTLPVVSKGEIPIIISSGIIDPLVELCYPHSESFVFDRATLSVDQLFFDILHAGLKKHQATAWFTKGRALLEAHLCDDDGRKALLQYVDQVSTIETRDRHERLVWSSLKILADRKRLQINDIEIWWAKHVPLPLIKMPECVPNELKQSLWLAHRSVDDPGDLTIKEWESLNKDTKNELEARLPKENTTHKFPTPSELRIAEATFQFCYAQCESLRARLPAAAPLRRYLETLKSDRWGPKLERPVLNASTPLKASAVHCHPLLEAMREYNSSETIAQILSEPTDFDSIMRSVGSPTSPSDFCAKLRAARKELHETVDEADLSSLTEKSQEWCTVRKVPHLLSFLDARESLRKLVLFIDNSPKEPRGGRAVVASSELYLLLKESCDYSTGKQYRAFEDKLLTRYSRVFPSGVTKAVVESFLTYCSADSKPLRDYRELGIRGLKSKLVDLAVAESSERFSWSDEASKKLLTASNVLAATLPLRLREEDCRKAFGTTSDDAYHFDDLCRGISEVCYWHQELFEVLTVPMVKRLLTLVALPRSGEVTIDDAKAKEVFASGVFECCTTEHYDASDGTVKSYRISVKASDDATKEIDSYDAERIGAVLAENGISRSTRCPELDHFGTVVPILRRFVDIGIHCLKSGYREFIHCIQNEFPQMATLLGVTDHAINGRTTGFRFAAKLSAITQDESSSTLHCSCSSLSDMFRKISSESEKYVSTVQLLRLTYPVLYCFNYQEIGHMLAVMRDNSSVQNEESIATIVSLRLGNVPFDMTRLYGMNEADIESRMIRLAEVFTSLCDIAGPPLPIIPPTVLYLDTPANWPLAVAKVLQDTKCDASPFQLCMPIETSHEILVARESFLRRVRSGVVPRGKRGCTFILVIPEETNLSSDTVSLLREECNEMRLPLVVIVHSSLVCGQSPNTRAQFGDVPAQLVETTTLVTVPAFSNVKTSRMFVVSGPTRSGKVDAAKRFCIQYFQSPCIPCESFISGSTQAYGLNAMLLETGDKDAPIMIEVGTGFSDQSKDQLQSLIMALLVKVWPSRDGAAARRKKPVVLKIHSDLLSTVPVLQLLTMHKQTAPRVTSTLSYQFKNFCTLTRFRFDQSLVDEIAEKFACPSNVPLSAARWKALTVEERHDLNSLGLPEYLMTFKGVSPIIYQFNHLIGTAKTSIVPVTCQCVENYSSSQLLQEVFEVFDAPQNIRSQSHGLVMTPTLFMSLIRLNLSVRCRQVPTLDPIDDGAVTFVGETGSGKTQLVDTFCRFHGWDAPRVIHVNSGTTESEIISKVQQIFREWQKVTKHDHPTVVFFDEFNTTPAQDVIKRIMLDRRLSTASGKRVNLPRTKDGWIFIAACNPYVEVPEFDEKFQFVSDRRHVILKYTVQPHISPSLVSTCWRLPLPTAPEEALIVQTMCEKCNISKEDTNYFVSTVPAVHKFLKMNAPMVPYSLRTVSRLLRLYRHFDTITCLDAIRDGNISCKHVMLQVPDTDQQLTVPSPIPQHHLAPLALAVNYFVSLSYEKRHTLEAECPSLARNGDTIKYILEHFGEKLRGLYDECAVAISRALPTKLHRTAFVNETMAVTYLCVYSQTPLILIGPPGSSKTLASFIVSWGDIHRGRCTHLRRLDDPHYFQCSKRTTAHSVQRVMFQAEALQVGGSALIHVFDEIGNADQAPGHPLRVLNRYLERSVFGDDGTPEKIDLGYAQHSAFIGTSNYFLDRSLMGRAIIVQRDNPRIEELQNMFPVTTPKAIVAAICHQLTPVESMQNQHNILRVKHIHDRNELTMRDVYALLYELRSQNRCLNTQCMCDANDAWNMYCCELCQEGAHCTTRVHSNELSTDENETLNSTSMRIAIVKSAGKRGHALLCAAKMPPSSINVQSLLLRKRLNDAFMTIANNFVDQNTRKLKAVESGPWNYQSHQRPLMLLAEDDISTVFAALDHHKLLDHTHIIYGKYITRDEQMIASTLLQLREAMITPNKICLLVDCEPLFDSLLDVFNGFYQHNSGSSWTVRVVLEGRSNYWPVTEDFSSRLILAGVETTDTTAFTPAMESRFEKIYVTASMFSNQVNSLNHDPPTFVRNTMRYQQSLQIPENTTLDCPLPSVIYGFHPLMLATQGYSNPAARELLARPDIIAQYAETEAFRPARELHQIKKLVDEQCLASILRRILESPVNEHVPYQHSLVLCPLRSNANYLTGDLHSAAAANAVLSHVKRELDERKVNCRTLSLRSATSDMLFEIAVRNTLSTTKSLLQLSMDKHRTTTHDGALNSVAVIAISHSSSNPLSSSNLLAACHFIATCAKEYRVRVLLFAPCMLQPMLKLTIPKGWLASYCDEVNPNVVPMNTLQQQCEALGRLQYLNINMLAISDILQPRLREKFDSYVKLSIAEVCFKHLKKRCVSELISAARAVAEVKLYEQVIIGLRWKLALHFTNHRYFSQNWRANTSVGWSSISSAIELPNESDEYLFLLSPSLEGGLPAAQCTALSRDETRESIEKIFICVHPSGNPARNVAPPAAYLHKLMTFARLSGSQTHPETAEIFKLVVPAHSALTLPFNELQMWALRHFRAVGPRNPSHTEVAAPQLHALLRRASKPETFDPASIAIALAETCNSSCLNRIRDINSLNNSFLQHDPLSDIGFDPVDEVTEQPPPQICDVFVRLALSLGHEFAKKLFCHARFSDLNCGRLFFTTAADSYPNDIVREHVSTIGDLTQRAQTSANILLSLRRYFGWNRKPQLLLKDNSHVSNDDSTEIYRWLRLLRNDLLRAEQKCGLCYIGHYVRLVRSLNDHFFAPIKQHVQELPVSIAGAITFEMITLLAIGGLPLTLKTYLRKLLGDDIARDSRNALDVYAILVQRLTSLITIHNRFLTECDTAIKRFTISDEDSSAPRSRHTIQWPFLTVHHRLLSTSLLDEVLTTEDQQPLEMCHHLEEALVGLPLIDATGFPMRTANFSELLGMFRHEPSPSELF